MWPLPIRPYTLESYSRRHLSMAPSMSARTRMYSESVKSLNFWVGCGFDCIYCVPSFQRQMKRQRHRCELCYLYEPHGHLERLQRAPPKTGEDGFIFFPSSSDWAFIPYFAKRKAMAYVRWWHDSNFLLQSKDPRSLDMRWFYNTPENAILATTIETDRDDIYEDLHISKAPVPSERYRTMRDLILTKARKMVTIEPIIDFNPEVLAQWIRDINPWRVYVGYNSHPKECPLPEPSLNKTMTLMTTLRLEGFDVRGKLLRHPISPRRVA